MGNEIIEIITSIILQIVLVTTCITIFYFSYTTTVENEVVQIQIDNLMENFLGDISLILPDSQKVKLRTSISKATIPDMTEKDAAMEENNKNLVNKMIKMMSIVFGCGMVICLFLMWKFQLDWKYLCKESLLGLVAVIIIEFVFLKFFVKNYDSLDQNSIKLHIVNILQRYDG
jgi:hypothetical protein